MDVIECADQTCFSPISTHIILNLMTTHNLDSIACPASCCFACNGLAFAKRITENLFLNSIYNLFFVLILRKLIPDQEMDIIFIHIGKLLFHMRHDL